MVINASKYGWKNIQGSYSFPVAWITYQNYNGIEVMFSIYIALAFYLEHKC